MKNCNYKLSIDGEAFSSMREDFDKILKRTVNNMEAKGSGNAEITIKLKIELAPTFIPPAQSGQEGREVLKPKFDHKVSSVINTKFEALGSLQGDYELVWDEETQDYIAKPIGYEQTSMFDTENGYYETSAEEFAEKTLMLEEAKEEADADTTDGDFDDIDTDTMVEYLKDMYVGGEE